MPRRPYFRAFARRQVSLPVTLARAVDDTLAARLVNLGLGGACVEADGALEEGVPLTLEVTTPDLWDPLVIEAEIAWVAGRREGGSRAGLRFDHGRSGSLKSLVQLLGTDRYD